MICPTNIKKNTAGVNIIPNTMVVGEGLTADEKIKNESAGKRRRVEG